MKKKIIEFILRQIMIFLIIFFSAGFVIEVIHKGQILVVFTNGYLILYLVRMYIQDKKE